MKLGKGSRYFLLWGVIAGILVAVIHFDPKFIPFRDFGPADIGRIFGTLFLVATFMERAAEVFVASFAEGDKKQTQRSVFIATMVLGVAVSALGVRGLYPLVDLDQWKDVPRFQRSLFHAVDVFLTAGLLAGGSDGIHKLINVFTVWFETTSKNLKKKGAG